MVIELPDDYAARYLELGGMRWLLARLRQGKRQDKAGFWLLAALQHGPMTADEIYAAGELAGFTATRLRAARKRVSVLARRNGSREGSHFYWYLHGQTLPKAHR